MLPGECLGVKGYTCKGGIKHELRVCHSNAGYYIGYFCNVEPEKCALWDDCCGGPISRESEYFKSREDAEAALIDGFGSRMRMKGGDE